MGGEEVSLPDFSTRYDEGPAKLPKEPIPWVERKVYWGVKTARLSLRSREQQKVGEAFLVLRVNVVVGEGV